MKRKLFLSLAILISVLTGPEFVFAAVVDPSQTLYAETVAHTITFEGITHDYYMYVPPTLRPEKPLVIMLHGYGGTAYGYRPEMLESAERYGFAVCVPQGYGKMDENGNIVFKPGWNVRYPAQATMGTDDATFVKKLKEDVLFQYDLNPDNVFICGMSNGGDIAYVIAYEYPDEFAAIASIAGLQMQWAYNELTPKGHVPFMEVHGTADKTSKWEGDYFNDGGWGSYLAVPIAVSHIVDMNRCEYMVETELPLKNPGKPSRPVTLYRFLGSPYGCDVLLYKVKGGKHSWHLADLDTTELVLQFFCTHLK